MIASILTFLLWAPLDTQDAEAAYARGKALYQTADSEHDVAKFELCAKEFEHAYEVSPEGRFAYNAGQCHRRAGHLKSAVNWYEIYLARESNPADREQVGAKIAELNRELALVAKAQEERNQRMLSERLKAASRAGATDPGTLPRREPEASVFRRWWVWTIAAGIALGGVTAYALTRGPDVRAAPKTDLGVYEPMFR